jgi:predicted dehydrogenase/broad specificity phosphatase PhoE
MRRGIALLLLLSIFQPPSPLYGRPTVVFHPTATSGPEIVQLETAVFLTQTLAHRALAHRYIRGVYWRWITPAITRKPAIYVGLVGSNFGARVLKLLRDVPGVDARIAVLVGRNYEELLKEYADDLGVVVFPRGGDYSVLDDRLIQAVIIASPPEFHYEQVKHALLAGKDVYVEKPFALKASQAEELVALAQRLGRILMVGHIQRYNPAYQSLLDAKDLLGPLESIDIQILNYNVAGRVLHGHVIDDLGPHALTQLQGLVNSLEGIEDGVVESTHRNHAHIRGQLMSEGNPVSVEMTMRRDLPQGPAIRTVTVKGRDKTAVYDSVNHTVMLIHSDGRQEQIANFPKANPLAEELRHFVDSVRLRQKPKTDGASAMAIVRAVESWLGTIFTYGHDTAGTRRIRYGHAYEPPPLLATVVLVRHGETAGNKRGVAQGHVDADENQLNEAGRAQALLAAERLFQDLEERLKTSPKDVVILESPLGRAKETRRAFSELVYERLGIRLVVREIEEAREISFGDWDGRTLEEIRSDLGEEAGRRAELYCDPTVTGNGGETFADYAKNKARKVIDVINRDYAGKTVILFGHGTGGNAIRAVLGDPGLIDDAGWIDWRGKNHMLPHAAPFPLRRYSADERTEMAENYFFGGWYGREAVRRVVEIRRLVEGGVHRLAEMLGLAGSIQRLGRAPDGWFDVTSAPSNVFVAAIASAQTFMRDKGIRGNPFSRIHEIKFVSGDVREGVLAADASPAQLLEEFVYRQKSPGEETYTLWIHEMALKYWLPCMEGGRYATPESQALIAIALLLYENIKGHRTEINGHVLDTPESLHSFGISAEALNTTLRKGIRTPFVRYVEETFGITLDKARQYNVQADFFYKATDATLEELLSLRWRLIDQEIGEHRHRDSVHKVIRALAETRGISEELRESVIREVQITGKLSLTVSRLIAEYNLAADNSDVGIAEIQKLILLRTIAEALSVKPSPLSAGENNLDRPILNDAQLREARVFRHRGVVRMLETFAPGVSISEETALSALRWTQWAREIREDAHALGLDPKTELERTPVIVAVNESNGRRIYEDLRAHAYYGFKEENILFVEQRAHPLWTPTEEGVMRVSDQPGSRKTYGDLLPLVETLRHKKYGPGFQMRAGERIQVDANSVQGFLEERFPGRKTLITRVGEMSESVGLDAFLNAKVLFDDGALLVQHERATFIDLGATGKRERVRNLFARMALIFMIDAEDGLRSLTSRIGFRLEVPRDVLSSVGAQRRLAAA